MYYGIGPARAQRSVRKNAIAYDNFGVQAIFSAYCVSVVELSLRLNGSLYISVSQHLSVH